jgi:hypothetical protein
MQKLGKAYIKVDGALLETMPGAKLDLGGVLREPVMGNNNVLGYAEKPKESRLECEIAVASGTNLEKLRLATSATITFEADTGQLWSISNAWLTEPPVITDGEGGRVPLKFAGPPANEI